MQGVMKRRPKRGTDTLRSVSMTEHGLRPGQGLRDDGRVLADQRTGHSTYEIGHLVLEHCSPPVSRTRGKAFRCFLAPVRGGSCQCVEQPRGPLVGEPFALPEDHERL